jgi:hypothetical protein
MRAKAASQGQITIPPKRWPSVFVFNPFAEGYIAQGKAFTPVKHQLKLAQDLANLPQFLGGPGDFVLTPRRPSGEFLRRLEAAGLGAPEFVELKAGGIDPESRVCQEKFSALRPWAWGPDSVELLAPLFAQVAGDKRTAGQCYNDAVAQLYSKARSAAILREVLSGRAGSSWLCSESEAGTAADTLEEALRVITEFRRGGHHKLVVKEALGVAGHNSIRLWEPELLAAQRKWMANALAHGRQLVIEPWLERARDFSVQFEMGPAGLKLCGFTGLVTDLKGQFLANWAAPDFARHLPTQVTARLSAKISASHLVDFYEEVRERLEGELQRAGYQGPAGVDAFVYRAREGGCRLKPIVEMNPRYTMGRLTLELMRHTAPGCHGLFRLVGGAAARGFGGLAACGQALMAGDPVRVETGKIRAGTLCLNDPGQAQSCLAVFRAGAWARPGQNTHEIAVGD